MDHYPACYRIAPIVDALTSPVAKLTLVAKEDMLRSTAIEKLVGPPPKKAKVTKATDKRIPSTGEKEHKAALKMEKAALKAKRKKPLAVKKSKKPKILQEDKETQG